MVKSSALALIDQGVWAMTNLLAVALLARSMGTDQFGLFSVALSALLVVAGLTVAASTEGLGVAIGRGKILGSTEDTLVAARARAWGLVLASSLGAPVAVVVVAMLFGGADFPATAALVTMAAPAAVVAEGGRYFLYATRRMSAVFVSLAWLLTQGLLLIVLGLHERGVLIAWTVGAFASAAVAMVLVRTRPRLRSASAAESRRRRAFVFEYLATAGVNQATVVIAGAVVGLGAAGSLRALQTVFGPLNILVVGIRNAVVPRAAATSYDAARRVGIRVAVLTVALTLVLAALVTEYPEVGRSLMGDAWPSDRAAVSGFALGRVAFCVVLGALVVLRAADRTRETSRLRLVSSAALLIPFVVLLPRSLGLALMGSGAASLVAAGVWWLRVVRSSGANSQVKQAADL